jgi:murein L,D-transpeptidase YcbB/YkuD
MEKSYAILLALAVLVSCNKKIPEISESDAQTNQPEIILSEDRTISIDSALINSFKSKTLKQFYASSDNKTVWGNLEKRTFVLHQLANADKLGLDPDDYKISKLKEYESKISKLNDKDMVFYDLLITYNFESYLNHIHKGKLDPKKLYGDWALSEKSFDVNTALIKRFNSGKLDSLVAEIQPKTDTYKSGHLK